MASIFLVFSIASPIALADDLKPLRPAQPNVEIINGKKFFSLQNARRFTGSTNSPRALSVMHHPRAAEGTIASRHMSPLPFANAPAPALTAHAPEPTGNSDKVLSIFAPDERPVPSLLTK